MDPMTPDSILKLLERHEELFRLQHEAMKEFARELVNLQLVIHERSGNESLLAKD